MTAPASAAQAVNQLPPLRHNRNFRLLWVGGLASMLGLEAASVAYPMVILALTGSPAMAGLFGLVAISAVIVGNLPAGDVVDRLDQRRVLLVAEASRLAAVASVLVAGGLGRLSVGHVLVVAAVVGVAQAFWGTAWRLLLRTVVPPAQLGAALAREEVRTGSARLVGPPLGGFLYGLAPVLPFVANALGLVGSWLCGFLVRTSRPAVSADADGSPVAEPAGDSAPVRRMFAGATALVRSRPLRGVVLLMVALNLATAPVPLIAIVVLSRQAVPSGTIGLALAGLAVGALAGTVLIRPLCRRFRPGTLLLGVGAMEVVVLWGLTLPLGPYGVMSVLTLAMLPIPALRVAVDLLVFRQAPHHSRGRTIATVLTATGVGSAAGHGLAGVLLERFGVAGALLVLLGLLAATVAYLAADVQLRCLPWPETEPQPDSS